jgi:hypothetical protein
MGRRSIWMGLGVAALLAAGCAGTSTSTTGITPFRLTGQQEVPPVGGNMSGSSDITITLTRCPTAAAGGGWCPQAFGTVTVSGFSGTAAHIHRGKAGQNGPVIVTLTKTGENSWAVPPTTMISDSDYGAYQDNELYVNVHSANNPNGEVRGQLRPTP